MEHCGFPDCTYTNNSLQGIAAHKKVHLSEEEREKVQQKRRETMAAKKNNPDAIFDKLEKITKILVPNPQDMYKYFEEIAEIRQVLLQFLKR